VISLGFQSVVVMISGGITAAVLVYDVKRAIVPRIFGEQRWRRWRAVATVIAVAAVAFLQREVGPLWLKRIVMAAFALSFVVVLGCSIPLKRLVERSLQSRRED
jgi:hypothetical protein